MFAGKFKTKIFFKNIAISMGLKIRVISSSDDLATLLLIFTIAHRLVAVYPQLLPDLASMDVVGRSDLFKWDH